MKDVIKKRIKTKMPRLSKAIYMAAITIEGQKLQIVHEFRYPRVLISNDKKIKNK